MAQAATLTISLTGVTQDLGAGFSIAGDQTARFELPEKLSKGQIMAMKNDFATLASIAEEHPEDVLEACNAVLRHDRVGAQGIADRIGMNESNLRANQGQAVGAVVGAVVLVIVLGALLEHDTPPPHPVDAGAPDAGAPDAGPG